jgi:uncharacterized protein YbjT (DUF2867 family)
MSYQRILITGGTGFIGRSIAAKLAAQNRQVVVVTRRRGASKQLWPLPTVEVVEANIHDDVQLETVMRGCNAVINLVGILHGRPGRNADPKQLGDGGDPYGPDFSKAQVELPKRIADACLKVGIKRIIHMSALGLGDGDKRTLPSMYLRSKAAGEQMIKQTLGLEWTIFRPSVVFGPDDKFLNTFAHMQAFFPFIPLARASARFQPVYVGDVAQAFVNALDLPVTIGNTYDLVGPQVYSLKGLVQIAGRLAGHERAVIELPDSLGRLQALALEMAPGPTLMSRDNFDSMSINNVSAEGVAAELGLQPKSIHDIGPTYLAPKVDRYGEARSRASR